MRASCTVSAYLHAVCMRQVLCNVCRWNLVMWTRKRKDRREYSNEILIMFLFFGLLAAKYLLGNLGKHKLN